MSSKAVREAAVAMVTDPSWPAAYPYFPTANTFDDIPEGIGGLNDWCTLQYEAPEREYFGIGCPERREYGAISIIILSGKGLGDQDAMDAGPLMLPLIDAWAWPVKMTITGVTPPDEVEVSPKGAWQRYDVVIEYWFDSIDGT